MTVSAIFPLMYFPPVGCAVPSTFLQRVQAKEPKGRPTSNVGHSRLILRPLAWLVAKALSPEIQRLAIEMW